MSDCRTPLAIFLRGILLVAWIVAPINFSVAQEKTNSAKTLPKNWNWKTGDTVYQLLTVTKQPKFQMQGVGFSSQIRYKIFSRLTMRVGVFDRSLTVKQVVETTKLEKADELARPLLEGMLKDLTGQTISIRLSPSGEVEKVEGIPEPKRVADGQNFQGLVMSSLIDRDGWKELAKATFFTPPDSFSPNTPWTEPTEHAWGDFGDWKGITQYKYLGIKEHLHSVGYQLNLQYQPPKPGQSQLPFRIANPRFRVQSAAGKLLYDAKAGRLDSMSETFHVQGTLQIGIAGQMIPLALDEKQQFEIQLFDEKPAPEKR